MTTAHRPPELMLDLDDVLCINAQYGGTHAHLAAYRPSQASSDLYHRVFEAGAVAALNQLMVEFRPQVVMTTSWLSLLPDRGHFVDLFNRTGLPLVAQALHDNWDAPTNRGESRLAAIDRWLGLHHAGQPLLILDDEESGSSLVGSSHHRAGRVILCEVNRGFHVGLLDAARIALRTPYRKGK